MTVRPTTTTMDLVADILDMHRGCWLTLQRVRAEADLARVRQHRDPLAHWELLRGYSIIQSASSVERRLSEGVRWWQDEWRPAWMVELRVTWPIQ